MDKNALPGDAIKWTITNQCHPQYKKQNQKLKVTVLNSHYYHHENWDGCKLYKDRSWLFQKTDTKKNSF